jgi:hypothetical protein
MRGTPRRLRTRAPLSPASRRVCVLEPPDDPRAPVPAAPPPVAALASPPSPRARRNYTADITRTFPASGAFAGRGRDAYELTLAMQARCLAAVAPGAEWARDVEAPARRLMLEGLKGLGLLRGGVDVGWGGGGGGGARRARVGFAAALGGKQPVAPGVTDPLATTQLPVVCV